MVSQFFRDLPRCLFAHLEDVVGVMLPSHLRVALVLETVRVEERVTFFPGMPGRPKVSRRAIARAFVAKATLNIPTTRDLLERLAADVRLRRIVGFEGRVPSESTFSRAFAEFAREATLDRTHETAVRAHLGSEVVHHASLDASAIPAREKGTPKVVAPPRPKQPRGRKPNGEKREPTRLERQLDQSWQESLRELPGVCDVGAKIGSKGRLETWRGYKAHVSVSDAGIPLAFWTTSASLHDSQAAIPLMRMTAERVGFVFYHLMDKAYQGPPIAQAAERLGQALIVPPKTPKEKNKDPNSTQQNKGGSPTEPPSKDSSPPSKTTTEQDLSSSKAKRKSTLTS